MNIYSNKDLMKREVDQKIKQTEEMKLIKDLGMIYVKPTSKQKSRCGIYECPMCMKHFQTYTSIVKSGKSTKCRDCSHTKHGLHKHPLYARWKLMNSRCANIKDKDYKNYGGRGIVVDDDFFDINKYIKYIESLEDAYKDGYTIDRIDNEKGYTYGNIRWVSNLVQMRNRRKLMTSNSTGYKGVYASGRKWRARIHILKKNISIGTFETKEEAAHAYDKYVIDNNLENTRNFT